MKSYKWMVASLIAIVGTWIIIQPAGAQSTSSVPQAQAVYGGTVGVIKAAPLAGTTNATRIFVSMDSPNSVFYADADYSAGGLLGTNFAFAVVPDLDADGNHGTPAGIAVHAQSDRLYVADDEDGLLSCTIASNSLITNIASGIAYVLIESNTLFAASGGGVPETEKSLYFGTLDAASGALTPGAGSPLTPGFYGSQRMSVHSITRLLYVLCSGNNTTTALYKSSSTYDALSAGTTFAAVSLPTDITNFTGTLQFAIAPSGRLFVGGFTQGTNGLSVVYSDNDGTSWTTVATGGGGAGVGSGLNIVPNGSSNAYEVYYGTEVSSNKGESGSWTAMPRGGQHAIASHVNSGCVAIDPLYSNIVFFTTDKGFGGSTNNAMEMFELNNGLLAVQINDFSMSASKDIAWLASKAGVRRATNFNTTPVWTDGEFPNAIVSSIAMDPADASGLTAYAGSALGVYKTTTGGGTNVSDWIRVLDVQAGGPGVTNGISDGACRAIELDGNAVYAGFQGYDTATCEGRFYMSPDNGVTWTNIMSGINVNDIIVNDESGTHAVYVAVSKLNTADDGGIYRFVAGAGIVRDLTNSVNVRDLAVDASGGIYASGTIPATPPGNDVKVYYKAPGATAWSDLTTGGLPTGITDSDFVGREGGPVITVGQDTATNDIPILAVTRTLYYLPLGGSSWVSLYIYPNGTHVQMLYWDELLVGTSIGLYGQDIQITPASSSCNTLMTGDYDGDSKADPALYRSATGNWYVKLSAMSYGLVTLNFGGSGYQAVNGDFDGDGKADPAVYQAATPSAGSGQGGNWYVQLSGSGYTIASMLGFGGSSYQAVAGDYDGDGLADPAIYNTANGDWQVAMSSLGYGIASATGFGGTGYTAVQENYDSDNRFDAAVYNSANGNWTVLMSAQNYITATLWGFGGPGYTPVLGDFDGDGLADPALYVPEISASPQSISSPKSGPSIKWFLQGNWYVKQSASGYATATLTGFGGTGYAASAADFDGDGKADLTLLDLTTGIWHIKLSASGYAEATLASGYTP